MTTPAALDTVKVTQLITVMARVIAECDVTDNEAVNIAFGVYAHYILTLMDIISERVEDEGEPMKVEDLELVRDQVLLQLQKLIDIILERVPRRAVTLN